jgi:hypothetical protein
VYQPEEMKKDILKFKDALIKTHLGIYEYQTPEEFERFINHLIIDASQPLEPKDYYKLILKLVANIRDAHTDAHPFRSLGKKMSTYKWLPFQVFVKNDRVYITRAMCKEPISEGSEILSIDGNLSNKIVIEMFKHYSADGLSTSGMEHYLGVSYRAFHKIYPFVFEDKPTYQLTYRDFQTKQIMTAQISALPKKEYLTEELKRYGNNNSKYKPKAFDFKIDNAKQYAYLQLTRFFKDNFQEPESTYPDYYAKSFKEIADNNVKTLIVDLRDNDGGKLSNAAHLLRYFVKKPFRPTNEITTKGNDEYYLKTIGDTLNFNSQYGLERKANGNYKVTKFDYLTELKVFEPIDKYSFDGKIIVLIDGGAASAGGAAPALFREYTNAILVGKETFGTAGVGNGINRIYVKGDNTDVAISIPLMHSDIAIDEHLKRRGTIPDYEISNSIENIVNKRDHMMEFVLEKLLLKK